MSLPYVLPMFLLTRCSPLRLWRQIFADRRGDSGIARGAALGDLIHALEQMRFEQAFAFGHLPKQHGKVKGRNGRAAPKKRIYAVSCDGIYHAIGKHTQKQGGK